VLKFLKTKCSLVECLKYYNEHSSQKETFPQHFIIQSFSQSSKYRPIQKWGARTAGDERYIFEFIYIAPWRPFCAMSVCLCLSE